MAPILRSLALAASCACSSNAEEVLPYPVGRAMVFGSSPEGGVLMPMGRSCASQACAAVRERCAGDVYAEVILGNEAEVLDVICYPKDVTVHQLDNTPFESIGAQSDTVFVFDGLDDGADLLDEVVVSGENDVLYGLGTAVSVLGAGLTIDGPGTIVRALRVRGNVTIDRNDAKLSLVEIWGNLTINGDRVTLSESAVHGDILVVGTDTVLARNLFEGTAELSGTNLRCVLNQRFDDRNGDRAIDDDELGSEVACR